MTGEGGEGGEGEENCHPLITSLLNEGAVIKTKDNIFQKNEIPPNFCLPQILIFCELKSHAKFQNPTITPSWRKVTQAERERKKLKLFMIFKNIIIL